MKRVGILLAIAGFVWLASGVYAVAPHEQAIVWRFGEIIGAPREPGLHLGLPYGLDRVSIIRPREVKRVALAGVSSALAGERGASLMTGDRNLVDLRTTVQYTIADPKTFLTTSASAERLIAMAAEAELVAALAIRPVDVVLTQGKSQLAVELAEAVQQRVDGYRLGVLVRSVDFASIEPPAEVASAFADVVAAQREREQAINQAHSFAARTLADARGQVQRTLDEGRGFHERVVLGALGETERFERLRGEYEQSPELVSTRLYLDAMTSVLGKLRTKVLVGSDEEVDLSIWREEKR